MLRAVIHKVHEIAAEVIRQTGKDKPADAALREVLKQIKDLAPFDATEIARTVFIYYRWHVWLRDERGVESKMRLALRLDERFRANESNVPLAELRAKAVPAWTAEQWKSADDWLRSLQRAPKLWLRAKRGTADALAEKFRLAGTLARPFAGCVAVSTAKRICSRHRNFTRANLRSRTSHRRWSGCSAIRNRARRGGTLARAKAAKRCTCPT